MKSRSSMHQAYTSDSQRLMTIADGGDINALACHRVRLIK